MIHEYAHRVELCRVEHEQQFRAHNGAHVKRELHINLVELGTIPGMIASSRMQHSIKINPALECCPTTANTAEMPSRELYADKNYSKHACSGTQGRGSLAAQGVGA